MKVRPALAAALTSFTLTLTPAAADPLVNVSIQGRIAGTTDSFTNNLFLPPSLIESGVDIQYQIVVDTAPIGTTNNNHTNRHGPLTIESLTLSPEKFHKDFGLTGDGFGDGVNTINIDLFQLSIDPVQIDFITTPSPQALNADPLPGYELDGWYNQLGASAGINTVRSGTPQFHDRLNVRATQGAGVRTAIDPEVVTNNDHHVAANKPGAGLLTNSFRIPPQTPSPNPTVLRARWTSTEAGHLKINGNGEPIFILHATEADPDPFVSFVPLVIRQVASDDVLSAAIIPSPVTLKGPIDGATFNFGTLLRGSSTTTPGVIALSPSSSSGRYQFSSIGDARVDDAPGNLDSTNPADSYTFSIDTSTPGLKHGFVLLNNPGHFGDAPQAIHLSAEVGLIRNRQPSYANVPAGASFAGLSGQAVGKNVRGSTIEFLAGTNEGQDTTVYVQLYSIDPWAMSDTFTVRLRPEDIVVLQISYDQSRISGGADGERAAALAGQLAIVQNFGSSDWRAPLTFGQPTIGKYEDIGLPGLTDEIGRYGVDIENNLAWAVVRGPREQFAVIPEPSSLALLLVPSILLARRPRP